MEPDVPVVRQAFDRFLASSLSRPAVVVESSCITHAAVKVTDPKAALAMGVDESYRLQVQDDVITVNAPTPWGALHALTTLGQLVHFDAETKTYSIRHLPLRISDEPRFPHRSVLIDTVRHFLPVWQLEKAIVSLALAKFNVLHWHPADAQAFTVETPSFPRLWRGAYSPNERYTLAEVAHVVRFARAHGVRVMFEFDVPGHNQGWCEGYPEICPSAECPMPLNPAVNKTWDVIAGVLDDYTGDILGEEVDPWIHLGGDEANTECWGKTPSIVEWLKDNKLSEGQGYGEFCKKAALMGRERGRVVVQWEEVWGAVRKNLHPDTVIQAWMSKKTLKDVVEAGSTPAL